MVTHAELEDLVTRFTDAFNREDLDAVMAFFAEDALYDEFDGKQNRGVRAIRAAFEPQFRGAFGRMRFVAEDLFVDPKSGKGLIRWLCTLERDGKTRGWRGLDIVWVKDGRIVEKLTYAKAERLKLAPVEARV
ncbi:MAG TPA: nuclear transport factor 2 family protein [Myxococcota bacterium]|nr:nuclear transport factor 2 family protein [Myxococcota bacterium]